MKRFGIIFLSLVMVLGVVFAFAACKKKTTNEVKLPISNYEKVQFAFNGVEQSFKNARAASTTANSDFAKPASAITSSDALSIIFGEYSRDDDPKNSLEGISYNEPPMTQFQCLKSILEKVGSNYQFGTKYTYTVSGDAYLDIETGFSKENDKQNQYKYRYDFTLSIEIDIDENDKITAFVAFDIKLTQGNDEYNTNWFVNLFLDYDMKNASPNYKLIMETDNKEGDLAYLNRIQGYEYDYVEVANNSIVEWRKFDLDTNEELVLDANHQTFDTYASQNDFEYRVGNCKWYKNGTLHKFTRIEHEDGVQTKLTVAKALFEGLGMNSTEINASAFVQKQGTQNSIIQTFYNEISTTIGKNFIYELVCKKEDTEKENVNAAVGIVIKSSYNENWEAFNVYSDATLLELLSTDDPWGQGIGSPGHPIICYVDEYGNVVKRVESGELSNFNFELIFSHFTQGKIECDFALNSKISDLIPDGIDYDDINQPFVIKVTEKADPKFVAMFNFYESFGLANIISDNNSKIFPKELSNLGVPEYDAENPTFELDTDKQLVLRITNSNQNEFDAYKAKLKTNNFVVDNEGYYIKNIGQSILKIRPYFDGESVQITVVSDSNQNYYTEWQGEKVARWIGTQFGQFPAPAVDNLLFYFSNDTDQYAYIFGMTEEQINAYILNIKASANHCFAQDRTISFIYDDNYYSIEYNIEQNAGNASLFIMFNLERRPASQATTILVNGSTKYYFDQNSSGSLVATINLEDGDEITIFSSSVAPQPNDEYFTIDGKGRFVVKEGQGAVYTFKIDAPYDFMTITKR